MLYHPCCSTARQLKTLPSSYLFLRIFDSLKLGNSIFRHPYTCIKHLRSAIVSVFSNVNVVVLFHQLRYGLSHCVHYVARERRGGSGG